MNFEELLKYCTELNNSSSDKCLVCHIPIEKDDKHIKLACSHIFHPECVKYISGSLKCLYCEKTSVPSLINNLVLKPTLDPKIVHCKIILKSGPNKGKFCDRPNCKYHMLTIPVVIAIDPITKKEIKTKITAKPKKIPKNSLCNHILKSGPNKDKECGRKLPCKYHNKLNEITEIKENNKIKNVKISKKLNKNSDIQIKAINEPDEIVVVDEEELIEV